jgi:protein dithiol oxidoreductase (disulfide-forming)
MKYRNQLILLATALLLGACGTDETPTADEGTAAPVIEEQPAADAAAGDAEGQPEDEVMQVVEESAAEPEESGEQAIMLAQADKPAPDYRYEEGKHYVRLVPSQPTIGNADKIEVAEVFWYGCPHCYELEPTINAWAEDAPPNVRFVRIPAIWNDLLQTHARLFYTEEVLGRNGDIENPEAFRKAVFEEYHQRGNRLANESAIKRLFTRYGVSEEAFDKTWNSFEVAQKVRVASDLTRRYSISSVPQVVVNGKYRTGAAEAGGFRQLIEVIEELVDREDAS